MNTELLETVSGLVYIFSFALSMILFVLGTANALCNWDQGRSLIPSVRVALISFCVMVVSLFWGPSFALQAPVWVHDAASEIGGWYGTLLGVMGIVATPVLAIFLLYPLANFLARVLARAMSNKGED